MVWSRTQNQVEACVIKNSRRPICVCERDLKSTFSVSRSAAEGLQIFSCPCGVRLTHHHHRADSHPPPHRRPYLVLRLPFVWNAALEGAISLCNSSNVYPIPSSFLKVSDVSTNDTRMIIITIMYWFSGGIVALWVSAFPRIIVGLQMG